MFGQCESNLDNSDFEGVENGVGWWWVGGEDSCFST